MIRVRAVFLSPGGGGRGLSLFFFLIVAPLASRNFGPVRPGLGFFAFVTEALCAAEL